MATLPQKELRNDLADVLRRAEAGEEFTITVAGRPVAQLGPAANRRWVDADTLKKVVRNAYPEEGSPRISSRSQADTLDFAIIDDLVDVVAAG